MTKEKKIYTLLAILVLLIVSAFYQYKESKELKNEKLYSVEYIKNAKKLINLKEKWSGSRQQFNQTIAKIKSIKEPILHKVHNNIVKLQFSNIDQNSFSKIGHTLLNRHIIIKSLQIEKINPNNISLLLELQK